MQVMMALPLPLLMLRMAHSLVRAQTRHRVLPRSHLRQPSTTRWRGQKRA
jgi:hypothetical protein